MTLSEAKEILKDYKPHYVKVREALRVVCSILPNAVERPSAEERLHQLRYQIKESNDGLDPFETRSRQREMVTWRNCVFYQMIREGYTTIEIEKATGYDHSTIIIGTQRLCDYLDMKDYITTTTWNEFLKNVNK